MTNIQVTSSSMPGFEEYMEEVRDLWDSKWLTNNGEKHNRLMEKLISYLDVPRLSLFTNGHLALENALASFDLSGEVITTPYTFSSTTHAIVRNGLVPVFCDVDPETMTMDVSKIEELITERTSAILPVHVYGTICDVEGIQAIADKYGLKVIYDAAHAFGVTVGGKGVGNFGDASMFSFHATKVFHTIEGGAVTFQDKDREARLNQLKNFGITGPETVEYVGGNAKMNEFQAAMGLVNLPHLDDEIAKRKLVVERYRKNLAGVEGLRFMTYQPDVKMNYAYFPVFFEKDWDRDEIAKILEAEGIMARKYFYPLVNDYECYKNLASSNETPVAKKAASQVLTLPLYADLTAADVDRICLVLKKNAPYTSKIVKTNQLNSKIRN